MGGKAEQPHLRSGKNCLTDNILPKAMNDKQLQDWLANKQAKGAAPKPTKLSAEEQAALASFDRLWEAASPPSPKDLEVDTTAAWNKLEGRLFGADGQEAALPQKQKSKHPIIQLISPHWWKIAAAVALLLIAGWWWQEQSAPEALPLLVYNSGELEKEEILLPDGSKVWLNMASSLTYDPNIEDQRLLSLEGEAFFEVSRDENRPFIVRTGELETRVLGTSFNIRAYAGEAVVEVAVSSGQVAVENADRQSRVLLAANEVATYEPELGSLTTTQLGQSQANAWLSGRLTFNEQTLSEILLALERFYGLQFELQYSSLLNCALTAEFLQHDREAALDLLEFQFGPLEIQGDTVRLGGQSCH